MQKVADDKQNLNKCSCEDCDCADCSCNCDNGACDCANDDNKSCNDIENLAKESAALKNELLEKENALKRVLADYDNMLKDSEKRNTLAMNHLKADAALGIISVLDDINLAMKAREDLKEDFNTSPKIDAWTTGLLSTIANISKSLDVLGISRMNCKKGDVYDYSRHEALGVVYEGKPNTVCEVIQDGYVFGDEETIVRPAKVIVCKQK